MRLNGQIVRARICEAKERIVLRVGGQKAKDGISGDLVVFPSQRPSKEKSGAAPSLHGLQSAPRARLVQANRCHRPLPPGQAIRCSFFSEKDTIWVLVWSYETQCLEVAIFHKLTELLFSEHVVEKP